MSLITESDTYSPALNLEGLYVDQIPSFTHFKDGIICPCSKLCYKSRPSFVAHAKTAGHKKWIESLNTSRNSHVLDLEKERQVTYQQKIQIARMELEIAKLEREKRKMIEMIHFLSDLNASRPAIHEQEINLLDL